MLESGQILSIVQNSSHSQQFHDLLMMPFLSIILIPAAMVDFKEHRIPNVLAFAGWLIGPIIHFVTMGIDGLIESLLGLAILFALGFPLWLLRWMGAGDVKLMAGIGAMVGMSRAPIVFLGIVLTGLLMAIVLLLFRRQFRQRLHRLLATFGLLAVSKTVVSPVDEKDTPITLPYALPIAFGTFITLLLIMMKVVA